MEKLTDNIDILAEVRKGTLLNINEVYVSLQGEGTRTGLLTTFLRLHGCLLRCVWCDTPYALERREIAEPMTIDQAVGAIEKAGSKLVMLTGGEPLEQPAAMPLITKLCDQGYEVTIETNGQADVSLVDKRAVLIMDLKCPASGMHKKNDFNNLKFLKKSDELKFVISNRDDYDWALETYKKYNIAAVVDTVLFSPAFGVMNEKTLAEWLIKDKYPIRMQLQTHKYIWDPNKRGV